MNRALPTEQAVAYLARRWNLTEEVARRRYQRELDSVGHWTAIEPDLKAEALGYANNGIPVFPLNWPIGETCSCGKQDCPSPGKHPLTPHGFKDATTDPELVKDWWTQWPDANIGMPTGAASQRIAVDIDPRNGGDDSMDQLVIEHGRLPDTAEQMTGGGGRHIIFLDPGVPMPKALAPGIDLKADGGYIVLAPSLHPSGRRYEWDGISGVKALLKPADAPAWLLAHIQDIKTQGRSNRSISKVLPEVIPDGKKHDTTVSLAGSVKQRGLPKRAAFAACRALQFESVVSDKEIWERVESVYRLYPCKQHLEVPIETAAPRADSDEWPLPQPLQSELPPVEAFNEDLLPDSFRPLVADVAERMQVPMDYPAVVVVLCLAGVVNRRAMIQPKERDTGWVEPANLWGSIIGPPGVMKTPVIQAITRPLVQIQTAWQQEHEEHLAEYARAIEESELAKSAWKDQFKASKKNGSTAPERPPEAPEKPKLRRLIVNDATFEALHQTMSENCAGVLLLRDELAGWLAGLERSGHEQERAFCLEAWNGKNPFTMDRIGRGTIHVPACCMSLFGGIQPGRLRSYMADTLRDGPSNDGLIQRISVSVWPDVVSWEFVDRAPNAAAEELTARVFRKLVELDADTVPLNSFALESAKLLIMRAQELGANQPDHYLIPALVKTVIEGRNGSAVQVRRYDPTSPTKGLAHGMAQAY